MTERLFGGAALSDAQRRKLRVAQMRSAAALMPLLIASSAILGLAFLIVVNDQPARTTSLIWACMLAILLCRAVFILRRYRASSEADQGGIAVVKRAVSRALFMGSFWGIGAYSFALDASYDAKVTLLIIVIATLATGVVTFISLPAVVIAFTGPIFIGVASAFYAEPATPGVLYLLLAWFFFATPVTAINISSFFVMYSKAFIEAQEQTALSNTLLSEFQKNSSDWLWATSANGNITRFDTPEFGEEDPNGHNFIDYVKGKTDVEDTNLPVLAKLFSTRENIRDVVVKISGQHSARWWRVNGHPIIEKDGSFSGYMGTCSDVTSEKLAEQRILTLAESDTLTGLMNRTAFSERLTQAGANLERYGRPFIVLHLNFDGFKLINDTRGHVAGDRILAEASERIADEVRDGDCVARLGGDEFAILMDSQGDAGAAARLAGRLISEVNQPYQLDGEEVRIGLSIGIAMAPLNGTRPDQLLRNADLALYRAKADGRGVFRFFENTMDAELRERRMLESELRDAINNDELVLHFQPLVDARSLDTVGFEALIRWEHPIRGLLSPVEFIDIAENSSLISDLGRWTIHRACTIAREWPDNRFVAVNLSANHFMRSDIVAEVAEILSETGFEASLLELEITESLLITNSNDVVEKINSLKTIGVSVAMDDFGTGYSSLSYLMGVPFDKLKIDKSFVDSVVDSESGQSIVRMISTLARELDLKVTAEGVETREQAEFLKDVGCDQLQGYLFSKPMSNEEMPSYFLKSTKNKLVESGADKTPLDQKTA